MLKLLVGHADPARLQGALQERCSSPPKGSEPQVTSRGSALFRQLRCLLLSQILILGMTSLPRTNVKTGSVFSIPPPFSEDTGFVLIRTPHSGSAPEACEAVCVFHTCLILSGQIDQWGLRKDGEVSEHMPLPLTGWSQESSRPSRRILHPFDRFRNWSYK